MKKVVLVIASFTLLISACKKENVVEPQHSAEVCPTQSYADDTRTIEEIVLPRIAGKTKMETVKELTIITAEIFEWRSDEYQNPTTGGWNFQMLDSARRNHISLLCGDFSNVNAIMIGHFADLRAFSFSIGYKGNFSSTEGHVFNGVEIVEPSTPGDTIHGIFDSDFGATWVNAQGNVIDAVDMYAGTPGYIHEMKPWGRWYSPWKCVWSDSCGVLILDEGFSTYIDPADTSRGVLVGKKSLVHMIECDWGPLYYMIAGGYGFKKEGLSAYEGFSEIARSHGFAGSRTPRELCDILPRCARQIYNAPGHPGNGAYADEMRQKLNL